MQNAHDYAVESRAVQGDENEHVQEYRMHCRCGKTSRWNVLVPKYMIAQDSHADAVARGDR